MSVLQRDNRPEIPLGLGYALSENTSSLRYFAQLSSEKQKEMIEHSRGISSRAEMRQFVKNMISNNDRNFF